ncbi:MAG: septum formation initiator family protein, partial [Bacteroidales bacterium]|nr:septum formation initiator family protein [Bacteroidales bacterium]
KYVVAILVFFIWILFFDRNSMINQFILTSTLNKLENQRDYYLTELENDSISLHVLQSNKDELERFAREKYLMKKDNEDVYLIIEEE